MNSSARWTFQYAVAASTMFALLVGVDMAKGTPFADAWSSALVWAILSSAIFIGARMYKAKQDSACAICETLHKK